MRGKLAQSRLGALVSKDLCWSIVCRLRWLFAHNLSGANGGLINRCVAWRVAADAQLGHGKVNGSAGKPWVGNLRENGALSGGFGHPRKPVDVEMVEAAGVEPASVSTLPSDLHMLGSAN